MTTITLDNVSIRVKNTQLLRNISFTIGAGELVAIVGPNGAGKSTLIKTMLGAITPTSGTAHINGDHASFMAPLKRARLASYLPQLRETAWPITVFDAVALGRFAYGTPVSRLDPAGTKAVNAALQSCSLLHLAERRTDMLSGGELARVHCARVFASGAPLLIADEPIAALDPAGQLDVLALIRHHVDEGKNNNTGAVIVLHDLSLAAAIADRIVWMRGGEILGDGPPAQTVTAERINEIFNVTAKVETHDGSPIVHYMNPAQRFLNTNEDI